MKFIKKISLTIANFQVKVILTVVYLLILPFFALIYRMLYQEKKQKGYGKWVLKSDSLTDVQKQY